MLRIWRKNEEGNIREISNKSKNETTRKRKFKLSSAVKHLKKRNNSQHMPLVICFFGLCIILLLLPTTRLWIQLYWFFWFKKLSFKKIQKGVSSSFYIFYCVYVFDFIYFQIWRWGILNFPKKNCASSCKRLRILFCIATLQYKVYT